MVNPPIVLLTPAEVSTFGDILNDLFTRDQFRDLLRYKLDRRLSDYSGDEAPFPTTIGRVLEDANKARWWPDLLQQARGMRPSSQALIDFKKADKPPDRLTRKQVEKLGTILNDVFTRQRFTQFLALRFEQDINDWVGPDVGDLEAYYRVVEAANAAPQAWWSGILAEARNLYPKDPWLFAFEQEVGQGIQVKCALTQGDSLRGSSQWRIDARSLGSIESRICRIELPSGVAIGTGLLVGPDLVITNYHVIGGILVDKSRSNELLLRFDFKVTADGTSINPGKLYSLLKHDWLVDFSEYSEWDLVSGDVEPTDDELDYALLRVDGSPGNDPVGGDTGDQRSVSRGWIQLPQAPHDFLANRALYLVQCPAGEPMKVVLDTDAVISVNAAKNRVLYSTDTAASSSGAPCFDKDWNWVALHHSGDPKYFDLGLKPLYSQAIPVQKIIERLTRRGKIDVLVGSSGSEPKQCNAIILGSPNGASVATVSNAAMQLEALLAQRSLSVIRFQDKWARKGQHPELAGYFESPVRPILIQPIDVEWAQAYALSPELLKKNIEAAAGNSAVCFKSVIWLPEHTEDEEFTRKASAASTESESDIFYRHGNATTVDELVAGFLNIMASSGLETPPAFVYQDIKYEGWASSKGNVIRDVIIPEISAPLLDKFTPPEWETVPFSDDRRAEGIIHDIMSYRLSVVAINNFSDPIDQEGVLSAEFRDRLLAIDRLVQAEVRRTGQGAENIVRLGIVATTRPEKHMFQYLKRAANEIIARWRFVAVGVESPGQYQVDKGHLNSLCQELQSLLSKPGSTDTKVRPV